MKRLILALAVIASACGGSKNPTAPSTTTPPPASTPSTFTLAGTVTATSGGPISGATVRISDGANAGKSTTTASNGSYSLAGLAVSGFSVGASATYYNPLGKSVTLTSNQTVDFQLTPTPLFVQSGVGDAVFDMPTTVARVRVQAAPTTSCQNFVVRIGGRPSIINVILGTCSVAEARTLDSTYLTGGGGVVSITISTGIAWTFTEVRP